MDHLAGRILSLDGLVLARRRRRHSFRIAVAPRRAPVRHRSAVSAARTRRHQPRRRHRHQSALAGSPCRANGATCPSDGVATFMLPSQSKVVSPMGPRLRQAPGSQDPASIGLRRQAPRGRSPGAPAKGAPAAVRLPTRLRPPGSGAHRRPPAGSCPPAGQPRAAMTSARKRVRSSSTSGCHCTPTKTGSGPRPPRSCRRPRSR